MPTANGMLPTLLLLQPQNTEHNAYIKLNNVAPFTKALKQDFNLIQHSGAIDLRALLKEHTPDLVMYDTSCLQASEKADFNLEIGTGFSPPPIAALIVDDAHAPDKPYKLQFCEEIGAEVLFCVDSAMRSYTADYQSKVILYPWFVNKDLYKDYNLTKDIPIGLFGYGFKNDPNDNRYPWRRDMVNALLGQLPFITYPRPDKNTPHNLVGEQYAKMLNRCQMAFCCGGVRGVFVKKMLEIPASRTCLVVEDIPIVREMGFVDEENCLMVNKSNVIEKCRHYLDNPDQLDMITENGYQHVLSNHTIQSRNQVANWLALRQQQAQDEAILQSSALSPLELSKNATETPTIIDTSRFYTLLHKGIDALKSNNLRTAQEAFQALEQHIDFASEVRYYLSLVFLMQGDKKNYKKRIKRFTKAINENPSYIDPALASIVLLSLHTLGKTSELKQIFSNVQHIDHTFLNNVVTKLKLKRPPPRIARGSCFDFPGNNEELSLQIINQVVQNRSKLLGLLRR